MKFIYRVFEQKSRRLGNEGFEKRTGKKYPPDVSFACGKPLAAGMVYLELHVTRAPTDPVYVPPGDTWPGVSDPRLVKHRDYGFKRKAQPEQPIAQIIDFADYKVRRGLPVTRFTRTLADRIALELVAACEEEFGEISDDSAAQLADELATILVDKDD